MRSLGKVQFGRIVLNRLNSHAVSPLRFAQGQALSTCASLSVNSAKGLSRSAARSFAALRMTGPDLSVGEELSSACEPCLMVGSPAVDCACHVPRLACFESEFSC